MANKKIETGLILVKETPFEKIRRRLMLLLYGRDYRTIYNYENLIKVNRPKNIIIPKSIKWK